MIKLNDNQKRIVNLMNEREDIFNCVYKFVSLKNLCELFEDEDEEEKGIFGIYDNLTEKEKGEILQYLIEIVNSNYIKTTGYTNLTKEQREVLQYLQKESSDGYDTVTAIYRLRNLSFMDLEMESNYLVEVVKAYNELDEEMIREVLTFFIDWESE